MKEQAEKKKVKEKRTRRSTKHKKELTIFYNNINGFKSKSNSMVNIIRKSRPTIVALCETKMGNNGKLKEIFSNYEIVPRITKQGKGGLLIAVEKNFFAESREVTDSPDGNIMAVRLKVSDDCCLRLILGYGPQETEPAEEREAFMTELEIELERCSDLGEWPILIGDMNAKVQLSNGQLEDLSPNGKLLKILVDKHQLSILNFSDKCQGKWTHVVRTTDEKSVLDYVITNETVEDAVRNLVIDEDCMLCPFRIKRRKGEEVAQYSDHNSMILQMEIEKSRQRHREAEYVWRVMEEDRISLKTLTQKEVYKPPTLSKNPQENYDLLEMESNRLMQSSYKKVKKRKKQGPKHVAEKYLGILNTIREFGSKGKTQRVVAKKYKDMIIELNLQEVRKHRSQNMSNAVKNMTINGKFSSNDFWKAKRCIYSNCDEICTSVYNTEGAEVYGDNFIRDAYRSEFSKRLEHRKMAKSLKEYEERTNYLAQLCVEEAAKSPSKKITLEELGKAVNQLKQGAPGSDEIPPDFYKYCDEGFMLFILDVLNELKCHVYCPSQWERTLIKTIYKNKGSKKDLKNYRGVFLTQVISKIYERILISRAKDIMEKVSLLQAGSRSERGPNDNLFLMNSCVDHAKYLNIPVYITVYDFEQCFDALWLEDSIVALWKLGVRDDTLAIMYNMNKQARIKVKTPAGISEELVKPAIVKQGTVSGPSMCSVSTAEFVDANKGVKGFPIGATSIHTMILVDDVANVNCDVADVQTSHKNTTSFSKLKRLPLGGGKCFILPINLKKKDEKTLIPVLKVGETKIEEKDKILYIGAMYNKSGNNKDLIEHRIKQARTCMVSSIAMCTDITLGCYVFQALTLTHNVVFLPTLLFGAQVWTNLTKTDKQNLHTIQLQFLKRILQVPRSTSNCVVHLELGILPIIYEIHRRQLGFLHHILSRSKDDPVFKAYIEQGRYIMEKNWANESKQLRIEYGLNMEECDIANLGKEEWKKKVKEGVTRKALKDLCEERKTLSRATDYPEETNLAEKSYFSNLDSTHARILFRIRCKNWDIKAWRQYMYTDTVCRLCQMGEETIEHVLKHCSKVVSEPLTGDLDIYTEDLGKQKRISQRARLFAEQVKEVEEERNER